MTMMISCKEKYLLQSFYSGENQIKYESDKPSAIFRIKQSSEALNSSAQIKYLVGVANNKIHYYILCENALLLSEMYQWIKFGLGTSHTYPLEQISSPTLDYESSLFEKYPHGFLRIIQLPPTSTQRTRPADLREDNIYIEGVLTAVISRFERRPLITFERKRPLGRILRDFFWACNREDGKNALSAFNEIKSRELLDHKNLLSLELQASEADSQWESIVNHKYLSTLLNGVVAERTTEVVLNAIAMLRSVNPDVLDNFDWEGLQVTLIDNQEFFLRRPNLPETEGFTKYWKIWAIFAHTLNCRHIEDYLPPVVDPLWISYLLSIDKIRTEEFEVQVTKAIELTELSPSFENAIQVLEYSSHCFESELSNIVEWLEQLEGRVVRQLKSDPIQRNLWIVLDEIYYNQGPLYTLDNFKRDTSVDLLLETRTSWSTLFDVPDDSVALKYEYFRSWTKNDFVLEDVISSINKAADPEHIRNLLPHFIRWIDEQEVNTNASLWLELIELMSLDEYKSASTLELMSDILVKFLENPHSKSEYTQVVDALFLCIDEEISPKSLGAIISLFELLFEYAIKDDKLVHIIFMKSVDKFARRFWVRLSLNQQIGVRELAKLISGEEYDLILATKHEKNEQNQIDTLKNLHCKVGIYSLTEKSLQRAKEIIEAYCPNAEVIINSDKTNTPALNNMANKVDILLFCDRSAAHQAYYAIKAVKVNLVYVKGKGASSIVAALIDRIIE
jgi:hypothetical protein